MISNNFRDMDIGGDWKREKKHGTAEDSAAHSEQEVCKVIRDVKVEMEDIKKYIKPPKIHLKNFNRSCNQ